MQIIKNIFEVSKLILTVGVVGFLLSVLHLANQIERSAAPSKNIVTYPSYQ